jgi:hypothetical protein
MRLPPEVRIVGIQLMYSKMRAPDDKPEAAFPQNNFCRVTRFSRATK